VEPEECEVCYDQVAAHIVRIQVNWADELAELVCDDCLPSRISRLKEMGYEVRPTPLT
jgi:hypothetical protein